MFKGLRSLVLLVAGTVLAGMLPGAAPENHIIIFHFNDLHGKIQSLDKVAFLVNQERQRNKDVFLVCAGDSFTGNPVVDQSTPKGEPVLELYNRLGISIQCLGNHEFDYGQDILARYLQTITFPAVCANLTVKGGPLPQPPPYKILTTSKGIRMVFLGLIQVEEDTGYPSASPDKLKDLSFAPPLKAALQYRNLHRQGDLLIGLTHLGVEGDVPLTTKLRELDLIIGGHSHTLISQPVKHNGVLVTQAGSNGQHLGRIDIIMQGRRIKDMKASVIALKDVTQRSPEITAMLEKYQASPALLRVIAEPAGQLKGKAELGTLICEAARQAYGLDMVFQNNGGTRRDTLSNPVRVRDIYEMCPFDNTIVVYEMNTAEIISLIKYSVERNKGVDLQVSGIRYVASCNSEGIVTGVLLTGETGQPLDPEKTYRVGINNYIASAYTFTHRDPGRARPEILSQLLIQFIEQGVDLTRFKNAANARVEAAVNRPPA